MIGPLLRANYRMKLSGRGHRFSTSCDSPTRQGRACRPSRGPAAYAGSLGGSRAQRVEAMRFLAIAGLVLASRGLAQSPPPPTWRLSATPLLTLGGPEATGPTDFANVYAATFWSGRLLLLDGATQTLRLFEIPSGRHIQTFGRRGQGPGEFQNAGHLQPIPGDSLFVSDLQTSRYSIFDPQGRLERTVSLAATVPGSRVTPLGHLPDGTILAWAPRFTDATGPGLHLVRATIYRVAPDGTHADSLRSLPFAKLQVMSFRGGRGWSSPLGASQLFPAVTSSMAYFTSPTEYTIYSYAPAAGAWKQVHEDVPIRLARPADTQARRDAAVRNGASPQAMAQVMGIDTLPALVFPLAASDGSVWVVEAATDSATATRRLSVYTPDGRLRARIRIPSGLHPLAVSDRYFVAKDREPEAEEQVYVYAIERDQQ